MLSLLLLLNQSRQHAQALAIGKLACRERIKLDIGWTFQRTETNPDGLTYDMRTGFPSTNDTWALKPWILPSVNDFIKDPANFYLRPDGNPGSDVPFVQSSFDDSRWETVTLPHDCAIQGPFYSEEDPIVSSSMGRLPVYGVGWYRRKITTTNADKGKAIYPLGLDSICQLWPGQAISYSPGESH